MTNQLKEICVTADDAGGLTVSDLITALSKFPQDLEVLVNGYEGGFGPIKLLRQDTLLLDVNHAWYYGAHDTIDSVYNPEDYKQQEFILLLR